MTLCTGGGGRTGVWVSTGAIDPASSPAAALRGRVVTLDAGARVLDDGVVYARYGAIADVLPVSAGPPAGFEGVAVTRTHGTLFPGLIELHNHMPYDILSLWTVPRLFTNRDQWSGRSTPWSTAPVPGWTCPSCAASSASRTVPATTAVTSLLDRQS